jgi:hypothetical protein
LEYIDVVKVVPDGILRVRFAKLLYLVYYAASQTTTPTVTSEASHRSCPYMGELSSYAAEFTSKARGVCEICGDMANLKYMQHKNPLKHGRNLCPKCYNKYCNKEGTVRRSSGGTSPHFMAPADQPVIRKQIAQAQ